MGEINFRINLNLHFIMKKSLTSLFIFLVSILSFSQEVIPGNGIYGNPETLPKEIRIKVECFIGIKIIISYNKIEDNHMCNAAEFYLYANNEKLLNINEGYTVNLNNGDSDEVLLNGEKGVVKELLNLEFPNLGGSREEYFVISPNNAVNIFKNNDETVTLFLECSTPTDGDRGHGYGKCHASVPDVKILKTELGKGEFVLYHNKPNVVGLISKEGKDKVALITIDSCGVLIKEGI
jgi:hypothetical protein